MRRFRPAVLALSMAAAFASLPTASQNVLPVFKGNVTGTADAVKNAAGTQMQVTTTNGAGKNFSSTNWTSFSIGAANGVRIEQPNAASMSINRVVDPGNPSQIFGALSSNGKLVLVNQSGITVGAGALVDTAGFTASVLGMNDADAAAGRLRFNTDGLGQANGSLQVQGNIIARGGDVVLIAPNIEVAKTAVVEAQNGTAILAAGQRVEVTGRGLEGIVLQVQAPSDRAVNLGTLKGDAVGIFAGQLRHSGDIKVHGVTLDGGRVVLRALEVADVSGTIEAKRTINGVTSGGTVEISGRLAALNGTVDVRGSAGGAVTVSGEAILQGGQIDASGLVSGGSVQIVARQYVEQTASVQVRADGGSGAGGTVRVQATDDGGSILSSATISANGATGGSVVVAAPTIRLQAATVTAEGTGSLAGDGGSIKIGGGRQGNDPGVPNSHYVFINNATNISASSRRNGKGGTVVVWSDGTTRFAGDIKARGGSDAGDGGFIEVSGKEQLVFSGMANAAAPHGANGTLLLDPKNIIIQEGGGSAIGLDPDPEPSGQTGDFGVATFTMDGKLVVTDPLNDLAGKTDAGAVYVFDIATGALVGSIKGSSSNDKVGQYVEESEFNSYSQLMIRSPHWTNGTLANAGAVTFISPGSFTGSALVSSANSYVGSGAGDNVGDYSPVVLNPASGKALLFGTPDWGGGKGAIFKITASEAASGVGFAVDATTALVGKDVNDHIGRWGSSAGDTKLYTLDNDGGQDQFLLGYSHFDGNRGAVTLGNVNLPLVGEIGDTAKNFTLRGSTAGDYVGSTVYMTNEYGSTTDWIVGSPNWSYGGTMTSSGAVTVVRAADAGNFSAVTNGVVSESNSMVSDSSNSYFGENIYFSGNVSYFVVAASDWDGGRGVVTWSSVAAPKIGVVGAGNSLVGSNGGDYVGDTVNTYGSDASTKFVVRSSSWQYDNGASLDSNAGAITVIGGSDVTGAVSASNSLIGTHANDYIGDSVNNYGSQDYVIMSSSGWDGGKGAISRIDLSAPYTGAVGVANSLVGTLNTDGVGSLILDSSSGYVLSIASNWGNVGGAGGKGAVTYIPLSGSWNFGEVSSANSLIGYTALDNIGGSLTSDTTTLYTASYLRSGTGIEFLYGGNYLVRAPQWNGNVGLVAFGTRTGGVSGELSPANASSIALVGANPGDRLGERVASDYDGSYVVFTPNWSTDMGAITWGAAGSGVAGEVDGAAASRSLYGTAGAKFGQNIFSISPYYADSAVVLAPTWGGGKGAITVISHALPTNPGEISALNSVVGGTVGDYLGCIAVCTPSSGVVAAPQNLGGNWWAVNSPNWNGNAGAITFVQPYSGGGASAPTGELTPTLSSGWGGSISLLGSTSFDAGTGFAGDGYGQAGQVTPKQLGGTNTASDGSGKVAVINSNWGFGRGAITMLDLYEMQGSFQVSAANSLVGSTANSYSGTTVTAAGDALGSIVNTTTDWTEDKSRLIVKDSTWQGNKGYVALTSWTPDANDPPAAFGTVGTLGSGNAFMGSVSGDSIGNGLVTQVDDKLLIISTDWGNGRGAASLLDINDVHGIVDNSGSGNSMTGVSTLAHFGAGTTVKHVAHIGNSVVLASPGWEGGTGAITWIDYNNPGGTVSSATNSLVGSSTSDQVGSGGFIGVGTATPYALVNYSTSYGVLPWTLALSSSWGSGKGAITRIDETAKPGTLGGGNSFVGDISGGEGDHVGNFNCTVACTNLVLVNGSLVMRTDRSSDQQSYLTVFTPNSLFNGTLNSSSSMQFATADLSQVQANAYNGLVMMRMPNWGGGKGAIKVFDTGATQSGDNTLTATANTGLTDASNALVGSNAGDRVGGSPARNYYNEDVNVVDLYSGKYLVFSPYWNGNVGAVTAFDLGAARVIPKGVLGSANSLIGSTSNDFGGVTNNYYENYQGWVHKFTNGNYLLSNQYFGGNQGAITFMQADASANKGVLGASNSMVGGAGNSYGSFTLTCPDNNCYSTSSYHSWIVSNSEWMDGRGMVTVFNETNNNNPIGAVTDLNSLVGSVSGDYVGNQIYKVLNSSHLVEDLLVLSEDWNGARGAITWGTVSGGVASFARGVVSASNSLVGSHVGDRVGGGLSGEGYESAVGLMPGTSDRYYVVTPDYNGDRGAYTFVAKGTTGTVNDGNSIVGTYAGGLQQDYYGASLAPQYLGSDRYMIRFGGYDVTSNGPGQIYLVDGKPLGNGPYFGDTNFGSAPDQTVTITPQRITDMLEMGTNVVLQANNDITVNAPILTNSSYFSGSLLLDAGRSIAINADISLYGGDLSLYANHPDANQSYRDAGAGGISMSAGASIYLNDGSMLASVGAGANGGSIDLGNIYYGKSMIVLNHSTAPNAGITQIPGTVWDVQNLAMQTTSATGNIGTLLQPITFTGDLLAVKTEGGPANIHSLNSSLYIMEEPLDSGSDGQVTDPPPAVNTSPDFRGISLGGIGSLNLKSEGSIYLLSSDTRMAIDAHNIVIEAPNGSLYVSAYNAPAEILARGELQLIVGHDLYIHAGAADGAYAKVASARSADIVVGGTLSLHGGSGAGAYALLDPTLPGSTMFISATNVNLEGGTGANSYAGIVSAGGPLTLDVDHLTMTPGAGANADAFILAPNAEQLATGSGFGYLGVIDPRSNSTSDTGFGTIIVAGNDALTSQFLADQDFMSNFLSNYNDELLRQRRRGLRGDIVLEETCR